MVTANSSSTYLSLIQPSCSFASDRKVFKIQFHRLLRNWAFSNKYCCSYLPTKHKTWPIEALITKSCKKNFNTILSGNYSVYGLEIRLSRTVSPYLLNVYLPTAIFVVMSWVSFLIPTDVVPARIVLLVTLCLVIINTFNNVT